MWKNILTLVMTGGSHWFTFSTPVSIDEQLLSVVGMQMSLQ